MIVALLVLVVLGGLQLFAVVDEIRLPAPLSISVSGDGPDDEDRQAPPRHVTVVAAFSRLSERDDTFRSFLRIDAPAPGHAPRRSPESRGPPLLLPAA